MNIDDSKTKGFSFVDTFVDKIDIRCNNPIIGNENFTRTFDLDYDVDVEMNNENHSMGFVRLFFVISALNENNEEKIHFEFNITGVFLADKSISQEDFEMFLERNGISTVYGISRAQIRTISSLATNNETINLPLINVIEFLNAKKQKQ